MSSFEVILTHSVPIELQSLSSVISGITGMFKAYGLEDYEYLNYKLCIQEIKNENNKLSVVCTIKDKNENIIPSDKFVNFLCNRLKSFLIEKKEKKTFLDKLKDLFYFVLKSI